MKDPVAQSKPKQNGMSKMLFSLTMGSLFAITGALWFQVLDLREWRAAASEKIRKLPPEWFEEKVDAIKATVDSNGARMVDVLRRIDRMEIILGSVNDRLVDHISRHKTPPP